MFLDTEAGEDKSVLDEDQAAIDEAVVLLENAEETSKKKEDLYNNADNDFEQKHTRKSTFTGIFLTIMVIMLIVGSCAYYWLNLD